MTTLSYREGTARLVEGGVSLHGERVPAGKIIIATGSRPAISSIPGIESVSYLTGTTALELQTLPRSLLIVGGGYIGAELAQMVTRAGVAVTLVFRSRLLPEAEPEIGAAPQGYFVDEGITVIGGATYDSIRKTVGGVTLDLIHDGQAVSREAERVLITTGRAPNSEGLGLADLGIKVAANGGVIVDDRMRTTCRNVYAAGDVTGRDQFV
jgi:mercuric reductase